MLNRKENIINFLGSIAFILLFFLFVSAFSDKSIKQANETFQYELVSELHSNTIKAIVVGAYQVPSIEKSWISLLDKMNLKLFNDNIRFSVDNKKITQRIIFLQKAHTSIKPMTVNRFYYHLFPKNSEDLPILS